VPESYTYIKPKTPKYFYTVNKNIKNNNKNDPLFRSITVSESDLDCFSRVTEEKRPAICALYAKENLRHRERTERDCKSQVRMYDHI